jgi:SAM-dependent methyltransferase
MAKVVEVPRGYYARTHEERYRAIIGSGAAFRERDMSQYVQPAWREFVAAAGLSQGEVGVEMGSGTGINALRIASEGLPMAGLDISPTAASRAAELAREWGVDARFVVGDMFAAPFPSGAFDIAVNIWTLHAVGEPQLRDRSLAEMWRVLRPGGRVFLHNERSRDDVPADDVVTVETDTWNIGNRTVRLTRPDQSQVEVSVPGFMPEGLTGRRTLGEHVEEVERAGFEITRAEEQSVQPNPDVPENPMMFVFARKP